MSSAVLLPWQHTGISLSTLSQVAFHFDICLVCMIQQECRYVSWSFGLVKCLGVGLELNKVTWFFKLTVDQVLVFNWIEGSCQVNLLIRVGLFGRYTDVFHCFNVLSSLRLLKLKNWRSNIIRSLTHTVVTKLNQNSCQYLA